MFNNYNNNLDTPENRNIALTLADFEDLQRGFPSAYVESNPQPDVYYVKQRHFGEIGLGQGNVDRDMFGSGLGGMLGATALHYPEMPDIFSSFGMTKLESAEHGPATLMSPSGQYTGKVRMTPPLSGGGRFIDSTTPILQALKYVQEERERGAGQNTFMVGKRGEGSRPISNRTPRTAKIGKTLVMKGESTLGQIHDILPKKRGRPKGGMVMKPLGSDPATYTPTHIHPDGTIMTGKKHTSKSKVISGGLKFKTSKQVGHEFKNPKEFVGGKKIHFIQRGESPKGCEMGIVCGGKNNNSLAKNVKSVAKRVGKKITGKFAILNKVL
jgi:hypothetical protein